MEVPADEGTRCQIPCMWKWCLPRKRDVSLRICWHFRICMRSAEKDVCCACVRRKQCIELEQQFDFLKDLVAAVPDMQGEGEENHTEGGGEKVPRRYLCQSDTHTHRHISLSTRGLQSHSWCKKTAFCKLLFQTRLVCGIQSLCHAVISSVISSCTHSIVWKKWITHHKQDHSPHMDTEAATVNWNGIKLHVCHWHKAVTPFSRLITERRKKRWAIFFKLYRAKTNYWGLKRREISSGHQAKHWICS